MSKENNLTDLLTSVANAIRTKKSTTGKINPQDFAREIASIKTTPKLQEKITTASVSSSVTVKPSSGYDGLSQVTVNRVGLYSEDLRNGVKVLSVTGTYGPESDKVVADYIPNDSTRLRIKNAMEGSSADFLAVDVLYSQKKASHVQVVIYEDDYIDITSLGSISIVEIEVVGNFGESVGASDYLIIDNFVEIGLDDFGTLFYVITFGGYRWILC